MKRLSSYTLAAFEDELSEWGFNRSHAGPLLRSFYARGGDIDWEARLYPKGLRERVASLIDAAAVPVVRQEAEDGTTKVLLRLSDGRTVESVLMPDYRADRAAGCVSSQVGCAMGCDFCATAKSGFERNLSVEEIVAQFLALRREALRQGRRLQTLVFMGMGEPLHNYEAVVAAVRRIGDPLVGGLGWRQLTVSTVGIVPGMERLTAEGLNVHLAVSLHAPDDAIRERLLPAGKRFKVTEIMDAADRYQEATGRPVIIQYCLLRGVNDSEEHARLLAETIGTRRMHVNLLRYNPTGLSLRGVAYERTEEEQAERFAAVLRRAGVVAHFRRSRGKDIDAACGQLRRRTQEGVAQGRHSR